MSRVHDALRRAEQTGALPPAPAATVIEPGAARCCSRRVRLLPAPLSRWSPAWTGFSVASRTGAIFALTGFALDRHVEAARSAGGRVPHAAHTAESSADPAADPHGRHHESVAGGRQIVRGRESRIGRSAARRQPDTAHRLRFPPSDRAQPVPGGAVARIDRLPDRARRNWRIASSESGTQICTSSPPAKRSSIRWNC